MSDFTDHEAYAVAAGPDGRPVDGKNRVLVQNLLDRELLEEAVVSLRAFGDVLEAIGQNPMAKAMIPGL